MVSAGENERRESEVGAAERESGRMSLPAENFCLRVRAESEPASSLFQRAAHIRERKSLARN